MYSEVDVLAFYDKFKDGEVRWRVSDSLADVDLNWNKVELCIISLIQKIIFQILCQEIISNKMQHLSFRINHYVITMSKFIKKLILHNFLQNPSHLTFVSILMLFEKLLPSEPQFTTWPLALKITGLLMLHHHKFITKWFLTERVGRYGFFDVMIWPCVSFQIKTILEFLATLITSKMLPPRSCFGNRMPPSF